MNYITTNIRLPEKDYLRLKEEAAKKRKSFGALAREKLGVKKQQSREEYLKKLRSLDTSWFTEKDYEEYLEMKRKDQERSKMYDW